MKPEPLVTLTLKLDRRIVGIDRCDVINKPATKLICKEEDKAGFMALIKTMKGNIGVNDIVKDREAAYGSAVDNHIRIANLWSAYLGVDIFAHQVVMCMNLVKISRLASTPEHADSMDDIAGYMSIYRTIMEE